MPVAAGTASSIDREAHAVIIERTSAHELFDILCDYRDTPESGLAHAPVFATLADEYEAEKAMGLLEQADFHLHVSDALAVFHEPTESFDDLDGAMADYEQDVIDEQRTSAAAWALAVLFAVLAVYAGCAWMVTA